MTELYQVQQLAFYLKPKNAIVYNKGLFAKKNANEIADVIATYANSEQSKKCLKEKSEYCGEHDSQKCIITAKNYIVDILKKKKYYDDNTCFVIAPIFPGGKDDFMTIVFEEVYPGRVYNNLFKVHVAENDLENPEVITDKYTRVQMILDSELDLGTLNKIKKYNKIVIVNDIASSGLTLAAMQYKIAKDLPNTQFDHFVGIKGWEVKKEGK